MNNIKTIKSIPCPDGIEGCLVLHYATEEVAAHPAESKNIGAGIFTDCNNADLVISAEEIKAIFVNYVENI